MATAAAYAASVPPPELSSLDDHQQLSAPAAVSSDEPAALPPALAPEAAVSHDGAAEAMQLPAKTAAADIGATGCMQQPFAGTPAGTVPAAVEHSPQPAVTDADRCSGETAATEVQRSDDECSSLADSAPASRPEGLAAVTADGSVITSSTGRPPEGSPGQHKAQPPLGADGPHGFAAGVAGSIPFRRVSDPAAGAADATAAGAPAVQLDVANSPPHAGGTSAEMDGDAPLGANFPLQFAAGTHDETVNITSSSLHRQSPGPGQDAASSEGYRLYPDTDDGEAPASALRATLTCTRPQWHSSYKGTGMPK